MAKCDKCFSLVEKIISLLGHMQPVSLLLARLCVANAFFKSGLTKINNWEGTLSLFATEYKVPVLPVEFAAYSATFFELACPVLLALGLFARGATLPLLGITAVIKFLVYPNDLQAIYWATLLFVILCFGSGKLSLDHLIKQKFQPKSTT